MSYRAILTDAEIRAAAPSVFASGAHHTQSERYGFIDTSKVVSALRAEGFQPVQAFQQRVRQPDRASACKHLVRFRMPTAAAAGLIVPELVAITAHDGTAAWHLWFGVFRIVCENGLIAAASTLTHIRVQHQARLVHNVVEASVELARQAPHSFGRITDWQHRLLAPEERTAFATAALALRWPDRPPIAPAALLTVRRQADTRADLWTTLNVVQENLLRGGHMYTDGKGRSRSTRAVRAIDATTALNVALWQLTERIDSGLVIAEQPLPANLLLHAA
jgi:hypothetical protein